MPQSLSQLLSLSSITLSPTFVYFVSESKFQALTIIRNECNNIRVTPLFQTYGIFQYLLTSACVGGRGGQGEGFAEHSAERF